MNDDTRLERIEAKVDSLLTAQASLSTFVREESRRSRKRLDDLEEVVGSTETGLVVRVDRLRQKAKIVAAAVAATFASAIGLVLDRLFGR